MPHAKPGTDSKAEPTDGTRTTARKELVENQIYEHAVALFAERGFAGTSLQDIAHASGLTRPALYYYVRSKEDLLERLVRQVTDDTADQLATVSADDSLSVTDRLREMVRRGTLRQLHNPAQFRLTLRSEAELPESLAETYRQGRRRILHGFSALIEEGVRTGELRTVDPRTAAFAIIGMVNWVAWWHHPSDTAAESAIADQFADFAISGLKQPQDRQTGEVGVDHALSLLRQDMHLLERLLKETDSERE